MRSTVAQSAASTRRTTRETATGRSQRRRSASVAGPRTSTARSTPSTAGMSHGTRTGLSFGSQTRRPMLSPMKTTSAIAGGQRDSPMPVSAATSGSGASIATSLRAATVRWSHIPAESIAVLGGTSAAVEFIRPDRRLASPRPGRVEDAMQEWEYDIWYLDPSRGTSSIRDELERRGREGWELVATPVAWDFDTAVDGRQLVGILKRSVRAELPVAARRRACPRRRDLRPGAEDGARNRPGPVARRSCRRRGGRRDDPASQGGSRRKQARAGRLPTTSTRSCARRTSGSSSTS